MAFDRIVLEEGVEDVPHVARAAPPLEDGQPLALTAVPSEPLPERTSAWAYTLRGRFDVDACGAGAHPVLTLLALDLRSRQLGWTRGAVPPGATAFRASLTSLLPEQGRGPYSLLAILGRARSAPLAPPALPLPERTQEASA